MPITMKYDAAPGTIAGAAHAIGRQAGYNRGMRQWLDFQQVRTQQDAATARDKYYTGQQQLEREKFGFDREQWDIQEQRLFEQEQQQRQNDPQWDVELDETARAKLRELDARESEMNAEPGWDDEQREEARQIRDQRRRLIRSGQRRKPEPTREERIKAALGPNYEAYKHLPWTFDKEGEPKLPQGFTMPKDTDPAKAQTQRISVIEKRAKLASDRLQARMDRDAAIAAARENTPVKDGWFSDDSSAQDEAVQRVNDYYDELEEQYKALDDELAGQLGPAAGTPAQTAAPPAGATAPGTPAPTQPPTAPSRSNTAPQPSPMGDVPDAKVLEGLTPVQRTLTERGRGKWEDLPPERQRQLRAEFDALPPEQQEAARAIRKAWDENPELADAWFNDLEGRRQQPAQGQPQVPVRQAGMQDQPAETRDQMGRRLAAEAAQLQQQREANAGKLGEWQAAAQEVATWEKRIAEGEATIAETEKAARKSGVGLQARQTGRISAAANQYREAQKKQQAKLKEAQKKLAKARHDLPPELQARLADVELVEGNTPRLPDGPEGERLYAVLPVGWTYIAPDGQRRTKR